MSNPPAYQYYAADFDEDTASWNVDEVGIYQRLLNYSWINGWKPNEGLPNDVKRLCTIARCSLKKFSKGWTIIEKKFSPNGKGYLVNRRLEEQRAKLLKYIESQRESGKRGAEKRWKEHGDPISEPIGDPNGDAYGQSMALPSSSSKEEEKKEIKERKKEPAAISSHYKDILDDLSTKEIDRLAKTLGTHFKININQWVQKCVNKGYRVEAIILSLKGLWEHNDEVKKPWPYLNHVLTVEHQNINEREHMAEHKERKKDELKFTGKESIDTLAEGVTKKI